jgi:hypothetical protein
MEFWYKAVERFGPYDGEKWTNYIAWSKLFHLAELISLDGILCPSVIDADFERDDAYLVWEDYISDLYTSLYYLQEKLATVKPSSYRILSVVKEPLEVCEKMQQANWRFIGYDLIEIGGDVSALTDCGGFDETFLPTDLNEYGLIQTHEKAYRIKEALFRNNPMEDHADCCVWAIWDVGSEASSVIAYSKVNVSSN